MKEKIYRYIRQGSQGLDLQLSQENLDCLCGFIDLVHGFSRGIHIVSRSGDPEMEIVKQVLDSIAILRLPIGKNVLRIIDVGSGVGLPGIPVACIERYFDITLFDRSEKKLLIADMIIKRLGLTNVRTIKGVFPDDVQEKEWDMAVSKAFMEPSKWFEIARTVVKSSGYIVGMLGKDDFVLEDDELKVLHIDRFKLPIFNVPRANVLVQKIKEV